MLGRAELVGRDAAHPVVHAGQNRDRRVDRVFAGRVEREFANLRQAFEDLFAAEVAQIEEHAAVDAAAFVDLGPSRRATTTSREASSPLFGAYLNMKRSPSLLSR